MNFQLGCGIAQGRQNRHGRQLPRAQVESRAGIDITKWKLDQVVGKIRGDVSEAFYYLLTLFTVNLS